MRASFFVRKKAIIPVINTVINIVKRVFGVKFSIISCIATAAPVLVLEIA